MGRQGEHDDQLDGLDHGLNPLESSSQLTLTRSRWRWKQVREILEEIKVLQSKERGCMPNLQGRARSVVTGKGN